MEAKSKKTPAEEELDRLNQEIAALQSRRRQLLRAEDENFLEQAKSNIGRCFYEIDTGVYAKVVDVPKVMHTMNGDNLNRYQFPAIFIGKNKEDNDSVVPVYMDTIFSGAWGVGYDPFYHYKEIPKEVFEAKFLEAMELFKDYVLAIDSQNRGDNT